ncbi:hypothetical protein LIA77_08495 [Sarocladium implicatum]|nr:hypothetical protein LIA77_08495 [Sarocladium implicatum]
MSYALLTAPVHRTYSETRVRQGGCTPRSKGVTAGVRGDLILSSRLPTARSSSAPIIQHGSCTVVSHHLIKPQMASYAL